jgi:hypothetical protein
LKRTSTRAISKRGELFRRKQIAFMIYLIGVNHAVQFDPASQIAKILYESNSVRDKRATFKEHVLLAIAELDIEILAEEFNDEVKRKRGLRETVLEQFSKTKGIGHRFCEAGRADMWLSQIEDCKNKRVLFVCGDDHFESFAETLTAAGFDVRRGPRWTISDAEFLE